MPPSPSSSTYSRTTLLVILLLSAYIPTVLSLSQHVYIRQSPLTALKLPQCALSCYLNAILKDGCANEVDFSCHCAGSNLVLKSSKCIAQGCNDADKSQAISKMREACSAMGIGSGGDGGRGGSGGSTGNGDGTGGIPAPKLSQSISAVPSTSLRNSRTPTTPSPTQSQPAATTTQTTTLLSLSQSTGPMSIPAASPMRSPTASPSSPSQTPLAPLPPSSALSESAKAGISVSVTCVALSIFLGLGWYIRRLKRDLRVAQAATGISDDAWQTHISNASAAAAPTALERARSWSSGGSRRGRPLSRELRDVPISPLSPRSMAEITTITDNGYGVLKKKRGNVLSIVVEGSEEDTSSLVEKGIREPVPGQREGLSAPLELDGEWTGVQEMPLAVTPRNRSLDRDREARRPGTGG